MFNAAEGAQGCGHVGYVFRDSQRDWRIYGATEDGSYNWRAEDTWSQIVARFDSQGGSSYYDHYRCKNATGSSVTAAKNKATGNCLTRSIEVFKAFDGTLSNLNSGAYIGPNYYYDNFLYGFDDCTYLQP